MNVQGFVVTIKLLGDDIPKVYDSADVLDVGSIFVTVDYGRNKARYFTSNLESVLMTRKGKVI